MLTQETIEKFYKDVDSLNIKKKGAAITKATGFPKSNVSEYLNRKKVPSENFIIAFYDNMSHMLAKSSTDVTFKSNSTSDGIADKYIALLENNDKFFKNEYAQMLLSLKELIGLNKKQEALLKLNLQHVGAVEALQKGVEPEVVQEQINNQIADMGASEETDNDVDN
jgi:hypothetical protein